MTLSCSPQRSPDRVTLKVLDAVLEPRASGALWWPSEGLLAVADLHLGRSERLARGGGALMPPYETVETIRRLRAELSDLAPRTVVCVGDSFDDGRASLDLSVAARRALEEAMAGRRWVWVAGNHDPGGPADLGGERCSELRLGPVVFRHIADPSPTMVGCEVSGHYHPKARLVHRGIRIARAAFLEGQGRLILPAFGAYTGGLSARDPVFDPLVGPAAQVWLTGERIVRLPRAALC